MSIRLSTHTFRRAQSLSILLLRYEFPTIAGMAIESPMIVVESARPTPREIVSGVGSESDSTENTVTRPATVPSSPKSGAAETTTSSQNIPRSRRVISSCAKAFNASGSGFAVLKKYFALCGARPGARPLDCARFFVKKRGKKLLNLGTLRSTFLLGGFL